MDAIWSYLDCLRDFDLNELCFKGYKTAPWYGQPDDRGRRAFVHKFKGEEGLTKIEELDWNLKNEYGETPLVEWVFEKLWDPFACGIDEDEFKEIHLDQ